MPSESEEPDPSNEIVTGAMPDVGVATGVATGATFGGPTLMDTVDESVAPSWSVTVRVAV